VKEVKEYRCSLSLARHAAHARRQYTCTEELSRLWLTRTRGWERFRTPVSEYYLLLLLVATFQRPG
jgi:hypothetical protein